MEKFVEGLSSTLRKAYNSLSEEAKDDFEWEYLKREKSIAECYLAWIVGCHYAYLRKWGIWVVYLLTLGGVGIWMIADVFRIPSLVREFNHDLAASIMRDMKAIDA